MTCFCPWCANPDGPDPVEPPPRTADQTPAATSTTWLSRQVDLAQARRHLRSVSE